MQTPPPIEVPPDAARRFVRRALLIDQKAPTVAAALSHLGYIQIDPINVCGRMHDLILRNRVKGYREGDLVSHLHGEDRYLSADERIAFEHHLPGGSTHILVAFELHAWPHLLAAMRVRARESSLWSGRLSRAESALVPRILEEISARGPLSSEDLSDKRPGRHYWGTGTMAKAAMQKMYFHGRLLIAGRSHGRRKYDLPERVLPARVLSLPEASPRETERWLAITALRQRRLVSLKKTALAAVTDLVQPIKLTTGGPLLHCLQTDRPIWEEVRSPAAGTADPEPPAPLLLAPLDPIIYDRKVTQAVWGFDYVWEAYTPPAKRVRGHYAMPLLSGLEIVGHVDSKANRDEGRLKVVGKSVRRGFKASPAVKELAAFLRLRA
ncbi:MAG TPA: crosslink repair DNA glycosylase YcaQ family protein [Opitutaceae bacterium]